MFYSPYFITRLQQIGTSKLSHIDKRFGTIIKSLPQRKPSNDILTRCTENCPVLKEFMYSLSKHKNHSRNGGELKCAGCLDALINTELKQVHRFHFLLGSGQKIGELVPGWNCNFPVINAV